MYKQSDQHATSDDIIAYIQRKKMMGSDTAPTLPDDDGKPNSKARIHSYTLHARSNRSIKDSVPVLPTIPVISQLAHK